MDLTSLKAHIKKREFDPFYIFTGPEIEVMNIYIKQIAKVKNAVIVRPDTLAEIFQKVNNKSFIKATTCYVIRDCKDFLSDDSIAQKLIQALTDDIVIFTYTSIDKRLKAVKKLSDSIVTFDRLNDTVLSNYILRHIQLSSNGCKELINACEGDYSRILLEIDKIQKYQQVYDLSPDKILSQFLDDGTIYTPPKDAIFDFVDAVLKGKIRLSFKLLEECYASGEATMVILSVLYNNTKQLLQVQSYQGDNLSESTGLTPFQIKLAKGRLNRYSIGDLVYLMKLVRKVERSIKTGEIEDSLAVQYILVNLW